MSRFGREIPTSVGMTKVRRDEGAYRPWPACNSMPKGIDNAPVATSPRRAAAASITPSRSSRRLGSDTEVAICSLDSAGLNWLRKPSFDTDRTATSRSRSRFTVVVFPELGPPVITYQLVTFTLLCGAVPGLWVAFSNRKSL